MQFELFNLNDYQLVRELGRGGMAVVYEAIETSIARRVAVKILPPAAAMDARQLARFREEALVAARLDHPHIVPVYTVGCESGVQFYTMKYIDGRSLAELIDEERQATAIPSSREFFFCAAHWGIQAAEALHYAHSQDVVHGDIKPANLLVDSAGLLWLTDFGAARPNSSSHDSSASAPAGTLRYLSPEQLREDAKAIDHRSDVYSLGATLYELVTLTPAVGGDSSTDVLAQIAMGTVRRPRACNAAIPAELESIICRAMAADPQARYAAASELADDLRRFLNGQPVAGQVHSNSYRPSSLQQRPAAVLTVSAVAVAMSLGSIMYLARSTAQPNLAHRVTVAEEALPAIRLAAAFAALTTAEEYAETGRNQEAKQQGEQSIDQFNALLEKDPENSEYIVGLAYARTRVGAMLAYVLPPDEAEQLQRTAVALLEPLALDSSTWQPNQLFPFQHYQDALAECQLNLASCLNPSAESEAILNSAIVYLSDSFTESETDPWRTDLLARVHTALGSVLTTLGRRADAERQLLLSMDLLQQLSSEFPAVVKYRFDLAAAISEFGSTLASADKKSEASEQYQRAIDLLQQLVTSYPESADYHHWLAGNLNNLTNTLPSTDTLPLIERALQHELIAIRLNPEHCQYQRFASIQYANLATQWEQRKEYTQAAEAFSHAIQHRQFVVEHGGSRYDDKHNLGHHWLGLGSSLVETDRDGETEVAFRASTEQFHALVEQFGRKPHDFCMLAAAFDKWSLLMVRRGEVDRAREYLQQAIANEEEALRSEPASTDHRKSLAEYQARIERLNQSQDTP